VEQLAQGFSRQTFVLSEEKNKSLINISAK
jgi:hypothetical protein